MLKIKFLDQEDFYLAEFSKLGDIVVLKGAAVPQSTAGFDVYNDRGLIGRYEDYTTIYRVTADGVQFSNDGSVWLPTVTFTSNGGTLEGELIQKADNYSNIVQPTPISDENWQFTAWDKEIPTSGAIEEDISYEAIFEDLRPQPEPTQTIEERVTQLETSQADQDEVLEFLLGV